MYGRQLKGEKKNMDHILEALIDKLRNYPIGSGSYKEVKSSIQEKLLELDSEKYNKNIACFRSMMEWTGNSLDNEAGVPSLLSYNILCNANGIFKIDWNSLDEYPTSPLLETKTFAEDINVKFLPRNEVEYNLLYKQIVVGALIRDNKNVLLLQTNENNRISNTMTMVQGHVEFSRDLFLMSELEFLQLSLIREIKEELLFEDKYTCRFEIPSHPTFIINNNKNFSELEHFCLVYEIRVDNVLDLLSHVESGEPEKHQVTSIPLTELILYKDQLDDWVYMILSGQYK